MKIRRFIGNDFQETLALVKKELGPDAVIMSAQTVKTGLGFRRTKVEVTAALELSHPPRTAPPAPDPAETAEDRITLSGAERSVRPFLESLDTALDRAVDTETGGIEAVLEEVRSLRKELRPLVTGIGAKELYPLVRTGMDEQLAAHLLERAGGPAPQAVRDVLAADLKVESDGDVQPRKRVHIFVGPTGVGKTTTLAKLAAGHAGQGKKALITTFDRYRPGAEAQLRTYAERMNMPFKSLDNVSELFDLLTHTRDTVFVDTPGRSPGDKGFLDGLLSFQFTDMPVNTYLLLGANTDSEANLKLYRKYGELRFNSLIFTKTDEASRFGSLYNLAVVADKPVAYLTHGQQVPDDISRPTQGSLANLILGGQRT